MDGDKAEGLAGPHLPVDSSARHIRERSNTPMYNPRRGDHEESESVVLEAERIRADKIGRRGRTPTVVPQAYRSRRGWEKKSAVNKMVLNSRHRVSRSHSDRLRGLEDATVRRLLLATSRLHPTLSAWPTSLTLC